MLTRLTHNILKWSVSLTVFFLVSSLSAVCIYKYIPVYVTPLMIIRSVQHIAKAESPRWQHTWVPKERISKHMAMAVIASEDNRFASHNGFDLEEIKKAIEERRTRNRHRGASTISQQTAKNVFLWPKSSWVRKGFEAYFTFLIEKTWGKERIMEVYLNSIEMGASIYGVEACARAHFQTTADKLNEEQCALIAASLPNPLRFNSAKPSPYMLKRKGQIVRLMHLVPPFPEAKGKKQAK